MTQITHGYYYNMANISGISVSSISQIAGKDVTAISKIADILTSNIPNWPTAGPTCTPTVFGYSDGRRSAPGDACTGPTAAYDFDTTNGILYNPNSCGSTLAAPGYYSDGRQVYFWDGVSSFTFYDVCAQ